MSRTITRRRNILTMMLQCAVVLLLCMPATAAIAPDVTLDFEDLAHQEHPEDKYASHGVYFDAGTYALRKPDYNYSGYPPGSGLTVLRPDGTQGDIQITFDRPVTLLQAYYVAADRLYLRAYDADGNLIALDSGPRNYGGPGRLLSVSDAAARISSVRFHDRGNYFIIDDLRVVSVERPTADAGPDQTVEQQTLDGSMVTLDGSGSTGFAPLQYEWLVVGAGTIGTGVTLDHCFALGTHEVRLRVTDSAGQTDEDSCIVTVQDTTPPDFMLTVVEQTLWPPNHQMKLAAIVDSLSDVCDADPLVEISVSSNEPINDIGDGNTDTDWLVVPTQDAWEIYLRAERAGPSAGREYTISVTVTDDSGNASMASAVITVPHDQGIGGDRGKSNRGGKR